MSTYIVGAGTIGTYAAELLSQYEADITIVDIDRVRLKEIENKIEIKTMEGNAVNQQFLSEIGVAEANLFISVTADDSVNLISALTAKNLGAKHTVARVRHKELFEGRSLGGSDFFGIDLVFCPEKYSADEIEKRIKTPGISAIDFFAKNRILMREFNINKGSPFLGSPLKNIDLGNNVIVVGIYRNEQMIIPTGSDYFLEDDIVFIVGDTTTISSLAKKLTKKEIVKKNIMIFGGEDIGFALADKLENDGFELKIIESDKNQCDYLSQELDKTIIINGSALDPDFLVAQNIAKVDTFLALTDQDEDNLIAGVLAKNNGAAEVLITLRQSKYKSIAKSLGLDTVVNPMIITAEAILNFLLKDKIRTMDVLMDETNKIIELEVNAGCEIIDVPLYKANLPKKTLIAAILRGDSLIIPKGNDSLKLEDIIIVVTMEKKIYELVNIFNKN